MGPDGRGARVGGPPGWAGAFRLFRQASVELLRKPGCLRFEIRQKLGFPWDDSPSPGCREYCLPGVRRLSRRGPGQLFPDQGS